MGTPDELALIRDPFACKPAVVAETDDYVAISSEFRSLAHLPGRQARARLRAGAGTRVRMETLSFDLARDTVRQVNQRLHAPAAELAGSRSAHLESRRRAQHRGRV